jgi:predicted alpha/beta-fold hydrolase
MTSESFLPPFWMRNPHVQTTIAAIPFYAPPRSHVTEREETHRVPLKVGGFAHARVWWAASPKAPAVVILHGIAGSKDSHCCVRAAVALTRAGYHAVRLDMRGAGDSVVDAPTLYHAGLTDDLDDVIRHLGRDERVDGVFVLGFSGGGTQALKLAGEWGASPPDDVRGIVTLSAPLDYTRVGARMDSLACLPYRYYVLRGLLDRARRFVELHPERAHYRASDLDRIKRFRSFDGSIIVPMHGFRDVDTYYAESSAGPYLGRIQVPTLLIHAEDDPMVPIETARPWFGGASSWVRTLVSRHGGHLGWLGGIDEASWINGFTTSEALAFFGAHRDAVRPIASAVA